jgi:hypothetical protein
MYPSQDPRHRQFHQPSRPEPAKSFWAEKPTKVIGLLTAILGMITAAVTLLTQLGAFGDVRIPHLPGRQVGGNPSISISKGEGPSGTPIQVTGSGFAAQEGIEVRFHTEIIATGQTGDDGRFSLNARIPGSFDVFAPQQFEITAVGLSSARSARVPFKLTAGGGGDSGGTPGPLSIALSKGSGPSGTQITVSGHGFRPGEQIEVRFHTEIIATAQADSKGDFSVAARIPGSFDAFAPQQFTITATGTSSARSARLPFSLTR